MKIQCVSLEATTSYMSATRYGTLTDTFVDSLVSVLPDWQDKRYESSLRRNAATMPETHVL